MKKDKPALIHLLKTTWRMLPEHWKTSPPDNVMFGASIVNQKTAIDVARHLNQVNGRLFYSVEPQLSFINFDTGDLLRRVQWVIQGGESGPKKRPFNTDWARHTMAVCSNRGIPYFFKQVDKVQEIPEGLKIRQFINP